MSDNNSEAFATMGSGKSEAEVAFDLLSKLKGQGIWGEKNMPAILDMYAECLDAVKGLRAYEGQDRVIVPTRKANNLNIQKAATTMTPPIVTQQQQLAQNIQAQAQTQHQIQTPQHQPVQPQTMQAHPEPPNIQSTVKQA